MEKTIIIYKDKEGNAPYSDWLFGLKEKSIRYRAISRVDRVKNGNYGDHKRIHGIVELRLHFGKGYRIYFGEDGANVVILLIGGDKGSQGKDIKNAVKCWEDYNEEK